MDSKLNFVLNAHLPFVRHPEFPKFLEEDWLFEAMNESYIPLLRMMYRLKDEGLAFKFTFSISPTLNAMLSDKVLQERFVSYMESRKELGVLESKRVGNDADLKNVVSMYNEIIEENIKFYSEDCKGNILNAFNNLSNEGYLELITTAATHAFLPLFKDHPIAVNTQIETGLVTHLRTFDKLSTGFWLPDCAYYPGLDELLRRQNIKWTILAPQAFVLSQDKTDYGVYEPVVTPNGLYCFARDFNMLSKVLSTNGYTSDPVYREFYRDIGYDLPMDYIRPYIHEPEIRVFTGFKYWAITGQSADKVLYNPKSASQKTKEHAKSFVSDIVNQTFVVQDFLNSDPVYTLCFDAELFGHRWFEGVQWIENLVREVNKNSSVSFITPSEIIEDKPEVPVLNPAFSSCSHGGFSQDLIDNNSNAWLLRHIFKCIEEMTELADKFPNQKSLKQRFLNQAARETLLLMSSDWPVIIHNNACAEYAKKRILCHIQSVHLVYEDMCKNAVNTEWLVRSEKRDNLFPQMDYNSFSTNHQKGPSKLFTTEY